MKNNISTENALKKQISNDFNRALEVVMGFLKKTGKTDLQSQIDFMEFMNNEFI